MASRPQTLNGLTDSPVFLATYMLDHDVKSMAMISRSFDGVPEGITRDDFLDNTTHFWLTNSGVSASRIYADNKYSFWGVKGNPIPVAVSAFPDEMYVAPKSWAERAYPNLIHYNKTAKGGHFAAWEQPQILSEEIRAGFRSLR
jgi:pimeloyl-ACP methyl ester carboxylesterase